MSHQLQDETAEANEEKLNAKMSEPTSHIEDGNSKIEEWSAATSSNTGEPSTSKLRPQRLMKRS